MSLPPSTGAARRAMRRPGRRACGLAPSSAQVPPGAGAAAPGRRSSATGPAHRRRPAPSPAPAAVRGSASLDRAVPLDRVIAIVNDEALTQWDVNEQKRVVLGQMKTANVTPPSADVLEKQVLERLITERVLLQYAKDTGIRVDDTQVERALARIAEDNKLSSEEFRKAVEREGIPFAKYRSDIRNEITIQRLREREVEGRVSVSDAEVDHLLATQEAQAGGEIEYRLAHILVLVPEQASPDQIDVRQRRAETALAQVRSGTDFARSPRASPMRRTPCRAAASAGARRRGCRRCSPIRCARMKPGDVSPVLRSASGFHIVKLLETRQPQLADGHRADAPSPHPGQGERDHVERRSARSRSSASASGSSRARSSRIRRRPTRRTPAPRRAAISAGCRRATRCPTSSGR